jgi:hypothetical protein
VAPVPTGNPRLSDRFGVTWRRVTGGPSPSPALDGPALPANENVPRARRRLCILVCLAAAVLIAAIVAMVRLVF